MKRNRLLTAIVIVAALAMISLAGCGTAEIAESESIPTESVTSVTNDFSMEAQNLVKPESEPKEEPGEEAQAEQPEAVEPPEQQAGLSGYTVTIDPGHQAQGNSDTEPIGPGASEEKMKVTWGTSGVATGNSESQVVLDIGLKLRDYLVSKGVNVVMVRETQDVDISNSQRAQIANESGSVLFIRLHLDGADGSDRRGFWTLVPGYNEWTGPIVEQSRIAGEIVQRNAVAATGAVDLGITERTDLSGFNWCQVPSILCEMGYMSNPDEDVLLATEEYQQKLAQGMGDGIIEYLNTLG